MDTPYEIKHTGMVLLPLLNANQTETYCVCASWTVLDYTTILSMPHKRLSGKICVWWLNDGNHYLELPVWTEDSIRNRLCCVSGLLQVCRQYSTYLFIILQCTHTTECGQRCGILCDGAICLWPLRCISEYCLSNHIWWNGVTTSFCYRDNERRIMWIMQEHTAKMIARLKATVNSAGGWGSP